MALVFALRAFMPEGLVCCVQDDGRRAIELSFQGRCIAVCQSCACSGPCQQEADSPLLQADCHGPCTDLCIALCSARSEERAQLATVQAELPALPGRYVLQPAILPAAAFITAASLPEPPDCGPPLQLAGLIVLLI